MSGNKAGRVAAIEWRLSSSSDPRAREILDGEGRWVGHGPHYSRRTPGSEFFVGVGREVVLVTRTVDALWAVVHQRTPSPRGTGRSRGRDGVSHGASYVWRNMVFRRMPGAALASLLIETATLETYRRWVERYGALPSERLRTEVDTREVKSRNPGYCYKVAGWEPERTVRGKLYLLAPAEQRFAFEQSPSNSNAARQTRLAL